MNYLDAMNTAFELAGRGRGKVAPNPMVGAVVLSPGGEIVGCGFHPRCGEAHAEVSAIKQVLHADSDLSRHTLVVSLEPCNHHGRTPPCTDFILASGIRNVVVATLDPNPLMSGKSIELLRKKGCTVSVGVGEQDGRRLIRGFKSVLELGRPFITLKCAVSLDGKIATSNGESQWITATPARLHAHHLRSQHDSILVGVGTILADNPRLNVRIEGKYQELTKVVLDSRLTTPPSAKIFEEATRVLIYCDNSFPRDRKVNLENAGAEIIPIESDPELPGLLDLKRVFTDLGRRGVQDVLVEGGARVLGTLIRAKLFDRLAYFVAPKILGSASRDVFEGVEVASLQESIQLEDVSARLIGTDILIEGNRSCLQV